jgi:hypothetical protein
MKNFFQWAEEKNFDLSFLKDINDSEDGKKATSENTKRSGISANYPDAYVRSQYPHKYFNPKAADADYKLEAKPRRVSDSAAN